MEEAFCQLPHQPEDAGIHSRNVSFWALAMVTWDICVSLTSAVCWVALAPEYLAIQFLACAYMWQGGRLWLNSTLKDFQDFLPCSCLHTCACLSSLMRALLFWFKGLIVSLHPGTKRLECMNPNQLGRRKIVEGIQYPFGVTSYGKNLYYTDWRRYIIC